jgi:hypothetical protein
MIIGLGLVAFMFSTVGGVLIGKLMYLLSGGKVNPLIGRRAFRRCRWLRAFHRWKARKRAPAIIC